MAVDVLDEALATGTNLYPGPREPRLTRRSRRRLLRWFVPVAAVLVVVGAYNVNQDRTTPHAFAPYGFLTFGYGRSEPAGTQFQVALKNHLPDVRVISARPILGPGSAPAAVTLSGCRPNGPSNVNTVLPDGHQQLGEAQGDLGDFCSTIAKVEGLHLRSLGRHGTLVATVVPLKPGIEVTGPGAWIKHPVDVTGFEITYEQNGRHATQWTGAEWRYDPQP